jgi:hypothetical protein
LRYEFHTRKSRLEETAFGTERTGGVTRT